MRRRPRSSAASHGWGWRASHGSFIFRANGAAFHCQAELRGASHSVQLRAGNSASKVHPQGTYRVAALGGRFASRLRSVTGGDLGSVVHFSAMFQPVFASAQSLTAFDRRKLKCSRFSANDFEGFASTAANTPRPLTRVEYLGRHRAQRWSRPLQLIRSSRLRSSDQPIEIQSYATKRTTKE